MYIKKFGIFFLSLLFIVMVIMNIQMNDNIGSHSYDAVIYGSNMKGMLLAYKLANNNKKVLIIEENQNSRSCIGNSGVTFINTVEHDNKEKFLEDLNKESINCNSKFSDILGTYSSNIIDFFKEIEIKDYNITPYLGYSLSRTGFLSGINSLQSEIYNKLLAKNINKKNIKMMNETEIVDINRNEKKYNLTLKIKNYLQPIETKTIVLAKEINKNASISYKIENKNDITKEKLGEHDEGWDLLDTSFINIFKKLQINLLKSNYSYRLSFLHNWQNDQIIEPLLFSVGALLVNKNGERFTNEIENNKKIMENILGQNDKEAYVIYDSNIRNKLLYLTDNYKDAIVNESKTITELATNININDQNLSRTINEFRGFIKEGVDKKFNRKIDKKLYKDSFNTLDINNKYYAIKVSPALLINKIYIPVNENFEIEENNQHLEGFYCINSNNNITEKDIYFSDINFAKDFSLTSYLYDKISILLN